MLEQSTEPLMINLQHVSEEDVAQFRDGLNQDHLERLLAVNDPAELPPIELVADLVTGRYLIGDGYHRTHHARRMGWTAIKAVVHTPEQGVSADDLAKGIAARSNTKHGLNMSKAEQVNMRKTLMNGPLRRANLYQLMEAFSPISERTLRNYGFTVAGRDGVLKPQVAKAYGISGVAKAPRKERAANKPKLPPLPAGCSPAAMAILAGSTPLADGMPRFLVAACAEVLQAAEIGEVGLSTLKAHL